MHCWLKNGIGGKGGKGGKGGEGVYVVPRDELTGLAIFDRVVFLYAL